MRLGVRVWDLDHGRQGQGGLSGARSFVSSQDRSWETGVQRCLLRPELPWLDCRKGFCSQVSLVRVR